MIFYACTGGSESVHLHMLKGTFLLDVAEFILSCIQMLSCSHQMGAGKGA